MILTPFDQLGLNEALLKALSDLGYEQPSPIQVQSIPPLMEGKDALAQAQTGTGKTAAFALPILNQLGLRGATGPQALILTPTRELTIQVAEAFQSYAKYMSGFHVLPIYGGQAYPIQLKALQRGPHVIVGTPGRVMDHLRRGTLNTSALKTLVLDEADEMLRMGFIEDVEWILEQIKSPHQTVLFSATIPPSIKNVANRFLKNPVRIHIEPTATTVTAIEQFYMVVDKKNKLDSLARYFEVEDIDAALIFTGTKTYSVEVAEKLAARGHAVAALHGDMSQGLREQVISKLRNGQLDMVVATEVAARGLDVERITHVINLDAPQTAESYIHRIGRTGRAGRLGKALLFVTPREQRTLKDIERTTKREIKLIQPPSVGQIQIKRAEKLKAAILQVLSVKEMDHYRQVIKEMVSQSECSFLDVAAAVAYLLEKDNQLPSRDEKEVKFEENNQPKRRDRSHRHEKRQRGSSYRHGDEKKPKAKNFSRDKKKNEQFKKSKKEKGHKNDSKSHKKWHNKNERFVKHRQEGKKKRKAK